ncbi:amidohydrolase [Siphonobacter sp. SORGH_AS_0500]|uniref:amidohydrolase family protein n=1 Tax=Siphonobacter sp. SORGH_AS_0500 TaxID=1864824 RepID=UPI000CB37D72|nr:amidohydrolase family protein [Siphonobacter sp. SORGH_AS_0500]PKK35153.1 amidohydrolase [Siphonobacter sp. SORGH_AS_0500]
MKKRLLFWLCLILAGMQAMAQTPTFPTNGVQDERPGRVAFTNATIVTDAQTTLEGATLLIQGGLIEAVGKNVKIPTGTQVIDLKGKRIYPSFVEVYAAYGMPEVKREARMGRGTPQMESKKKGAYGWNQAVLPEVKAAEMFSGNAKEAAELRNIGFGSAVTHSQDGIVRGTSALVALLDAKDQEALLKSNVSAHYSYSKGSSTQDYPNSLMGSVALVRQTYYDAQWYKGLKGRTETNLSLEAFNQNQSLPQVFEVTDKLGVLRTAKIGKEFGVTYIIKGSGDEYQRLPEIKATGLSFILPVTYPTALDVEDPFDASVVSLSDMKHWEMAPANAGLLAKQSIPFSFTTSGLRSKADFMANVRKAIAAGLDEKAALAALTTVPAQLMKIEDMVGSLKPGMLANFLISSESVFSESNTLYENWVKGTRYIVTDMNASDFRGSYDLALGSRSNLKLNITGKADKPTYQIQVDTTKITPKVTRQGDLLTLSFKLNKAEKGENRISAYYDGKNIKGDGFDATGAPLTFLATYKSAPQADRARSDSSRKAAPYEMGKLIFPFAGYGSEEKAKAETILIKNATVWTNEKDGIVPNTDVLLQNGKIAKVGKSLSTPSGAKVIDGTGKHLTTGIFDEHSHIGLYSVNEGTQSVTSEVRMGDVVNSEDVNIYRQLAGGVTSSQLLHGSANCIGGQSAVIKLKWGETPDNLLIPEAQFIKFALGENVKQANWGDAARVRFPQTRMGVEQVMMDAFIRAKAYEKEWKEYNGSSKKASMVAPRRDLELDALVEILNKKRFITCHSYVQSEINMLMKVADSLGFTINTFTHILEGYKVADKMKKHGANGSTFSDWWAYKMEVKDAIPYNAAMLSKVGVNTAINSDDAEMARRLNQEAAKTVLYGGVSEEEAWKMVTLNPAKMMHLDNRLGSIKVGKDADVVLWNNNPLSVYAKPEKTIIEGAIYFDLEKDKVLRKEIDTERNRLIQKLLTAKASGAATQRPAMQRPRHFHCNTLGGLSEEEGHMRFFGQFNCDGSCGF